MRGGSGDRLFRRNMESMPEHAEDGKVKTWLEFKHGQGAEGNKKHLSSKKNVGPRIKGTKKSPGMECLLDWEGLLSGLPEGSSRICASEA